MSSQDITTPDKLPKGTTRLSPLVAWGYSGLGDLRVLYVWHWCDHHLWAGRDHYDAHREEYPDCWSPGGVGAHDLISTDPLHLEPSVYWPDCCGMHGWVRDGRWTDA
ncbi:MAG: hypothetical protein ACOH10_15010 [Rhodoglobus sp.]